MVQVPFDGLGADVQCPGDLGGSEAIGGQLGDPPFGGRQGRRAGVVASGAAAAAGGTELLVGE